MTDSKHTKGILSINQIAFMTADKRMLVFADKVGDDRGMLPLYLGAL